METKETKSLFAAAKNAEKAEAKTENKVVLSVQMDGKIKRFNELRNYMAEAEGELKMIEGEIKQMGQGEYMKLYKKSGCPGSFKMEEEGERVMFIVMDRYLKINEERAKHLAGQFGGELISSETTYNFNSDVLARNEAIISELIMNCKQISDVDKSKLIEAATIYEIAKGTINNLIKYGDKMEEIFYAVQPVMQLKNTR